MSASSLADLIAQHRALETDLAEAIEHPASSDAEIAAIKRKKLRIKDEITKLQNGTQIAA